MTPNTPGEPVQKPKNRTYDTGVHKWTHGTVVEWVNGRTPNRWLLGPCPACGKITSNYGGAYSCHCDYCQNSSSQFVCSPEPTPDWWNTDMNVRLDGNMWCAFRDGFVNLQESHAAFGKTPREAVATLIAEEQDAARRFPPVSEPTEGGDAKCAAHAEHPLEGLIVQSTEPSRHSNAGQQSDPSAPAMPAPAGDEAKLVGEYKHVDFVTHELWPNGDAVILIRQGDKDTLIDIPSKGTLQEELSASRREVAEITRERDANKLEWCKDCGEQNTDGEPALDCIACILRAQLATATEQLKEAQERIDWLSGQREIEVQQKEAALKESGECLTARDAAESRARAAEAKGAYLKIELIQLAELVAEEFPGTSAHVIKSALATDAGQPLLAELAEAKKDGARLALALKRARADFDDCIIGIDTSMPVTREAFQRSIQAINAAIAQKEGK